MPFCACTHSKRVCSTVVFLILLSVPAFGSQSQIPADPPTPASPGQTGTDAQSASAQSGGASAETASHFPLFKVIGVFGLVLGLLIAALWMTSKFAPAIFGRHSVQKLLKVLETLPMGEKRNIALIQVGNKRYLVGNTAQQITLLARVQGELAGSAVAEDANACSVTYSPPVKRKPSNFRNFLDVQSEQLVHHTPKPKPIPAALRAKMRELRDALER